MASGDSGNTALKGRVQGKKPYPVPVMVGKPSSKYMDFRRHLVGGRGCERLACGTHCRMKGDVYDLFVPCEGETMTSNVYPLSWLGNGTNNLAVMVVQSKETKMYLKSAEGYSIIKYAQHRSTLL